jgi:hypothetical protein
MCSEDNYCEPELPLLLTIGPCVEPGREPSSWLKSALFWKRLTNRYSVELIRDCGILEPERLLRIIKEANELTSIFSAARQTARSNRNRSVAET